jgi:hypothetical protein
MRFCKLNNNYTAHRQLTEKPEITYTMDYTTDYNMENTVRVIQTVRNGSVSAKPTYNSARQVRNYYKQQTYAYRRTRGFV